MTAGIVFELLYNWWDRLGDLLDNCFGVIKKGRVYFGKVVDQFPATAQKSPNYKWLKNFKDNQYDLLTSERHDIVHLINVESKYFDRYQNDFRDERKMNALQESKTRIADDLHSQVKLAFEGFEKTVLR
jgi:hypothetical protein